MQSVTAGYGGVRFERPGVLTLRNPAPLPGSSALRLRGLAFLGERLDVEARAAPAAGWSIALSPSAAGVTPLTLVRADGAPVQDLLPGAPPVWVPQGVDGEVVVRRHAAIAAAVVGASSPPLPLPWPPAVDVSSSSSSPS